MDGERDVTLKNLDQGFLESKHIQLQHFLNDQAEISNRLKMCRFTENTGNKVTGVSGAFAPDSRVSTAPEAATRTHRLRPLSARPSTASGRQFEEPEPSERDFDTDNMSVISRRRRVIGGGRSSKQAPNAQSSSEEASSASSPAQRPETVCGFLEEVDEKDEDEHYAYEVESDLDVISIESITSSNPRDDIGEEEDDGVTYEFDALESDRRHIEAEKLTKSSSSPRNSPTSVDVGLSSMSISSPKRLNTSPTRIRSSTKFSSKTVPKISSLSSSRLTQSLPLDPRPPPPVNHRHSQNPLQRGSSFPDAASPRKVVRNSKARSTSTDIRDQPPAVSSRNIVWGDSRVQGLGDLESTSMRQGSGERVPSELMSPRISFEEHPIERQGIKLRTVARIECDASFYRKLRHRSAPAMRTDELEASRMEGSNSKNVTGGRPKPIGIYHLPPLSKETPLQPSTNPSSLSSPSSSTIHPDVSSLTSTEFLAQHQHKVVFQEPKVLH